MVLHVFSNMRNYPVAFANFASSLDPERNHRFIFRSWDANHGLSEEALSRSIKITSKKELLFKLTPMLKQAERVFFHSFTIGIALFYWVYAIRKIRSAWLVVYGTEIYWYRYAAPSAWNRIQERMRRIIFRRIGHIVTTIREDYNLFRSSYAPGVVHVDAFVPIPGNITGLKFNPAPHTPGTGISILLGNSATPSNYHQDALEKLSRSPIAERISIYCPLSYGDPQYAEEVSRLGQKLFSTRFHGMMEFLPPEQYYEFLGHIDLAMMNHDRQQALGNIFALLYIGKKVYIRDDNPIFTWFGEQEMVVGNVREIFEGGTHIPVSLTPEEALKNHRVMEELLSESNYQRMWLPILEGHD